MSGTAYAYSETEQIARTLTQIAIEVIADPAKLDAARALVV